MLLFKNLKVVTIFLEKNVDMSSCWNAFQSQIKEWQFWDQHHEPQPQLRCSAILLKIAT